MYSESVSCNKEPSHHSIGCKVMLMYMNILIYEYMNMWSNVFDNTSCVTVYVIYYVFEFAPQTCDEILKSAQ